MHISDFPPWKKSDFKTHGFIATYLLNGCRCKKCKARYEAWLIEPEYILPRNYNFD
mgnify:CR=1 FL=1